MCHSIFIGRYIKAKCSTSLYSGFDLRQVSMYCEIKNCGKLKKTNGNTTTLHTIYQNIYNENIDF